MSSLFQQTLHNEIRCTGVGLHSGQPVTLTLSPAAPDTGIAFVRSDLPLSHGIVPARYNFVSDTTLGTTLTNHAGTKVATVEHLMAAFSGMGVDNAIVTLDGPEVPVMDGSSAPFVFLIECAGIVEQAAPRHYIRVLKEVTVRDEKNGGFATLSPAEEFSVTLEIDFANRVIAKQKASFNFSRSSFKNTVSRARTFGLKQEVSHLRAKGLALGGSLENAVVVDEDRVINEGGLRYKDEFVRHKVLDCVGDLYLAGGHILGHFEGYRSGHCLNNRLLRALFADASAWEIAAEVADMPAAVLSAQAAAFSAAA